MTQKLFLKMLLTPVFILKDPKNIRRNSSLRILSSFFSQARSLEHDFKTAQNDTQHNGEFLRRNRWSRSPENAQPCCIVVTASLRKGQRNRFTAVPSSRKLGGRLVSCRTVDCGGLRLQGDLFSLCREFRHGMVSVEMESRVPYLAGP